MKDVSSEINNLKSQKGNADIKVKKYTIQSQNVQIRHRRSSSEFYKVMTMVYVDVNSVNSDMVCNIYDTIPKVKNLINGLNGCGTI